MEISISLILSLFDSFRFPPLLEYSPLQPGDNTLAKEGSVVVLVKELESVFFSAQPAPPVVEAARNVLGQDARLTRISPTASVFENLSLSSEDKHISGESLVYPYMPFQKDNPFPKKDVNNDFPPLMAEFRQDFIKALKQATSPESFFRMCLRLMERYTWCVASSDYLPYVSVYDSAALLAAVTACLCQTDMEPSFVLLAADFSGIQSYIFPEIAQHEGAAKKLRSRSFLVSSVMQLVQNIILKEFGLPLTCTLMNSGGNLYLLLPGLSDTEQRCQSLREIFDKEIFSRFHGSVSVHIATTRMQPNDFSQFGLAIQRIRENLYREKHKGFQSCLMSNGTWAADKPLEMKGHREYGLCKGCGGAFAQNKDGLCSYCLMEQEIGWKLTKSNTVSLVRNTDAGDLLLNRDGFIITLNKNGFISLGGWSLSFGASGEEGIFALSSGNVATRMYPVVRLANHVPTDKNGQIVTFDQLAENISQGVKKLAVLKADVDRMGALFSYGFQKENKPNNVTSLQYTTLSRMLEYFFCEYLAVLIREKYANCYTVFSGGDDLLIVGPWQEIIELALGIQKKFEAYCGNNPDITLSAGISLFSHKTPISFAVQEAERALEQAKENGDQKQKGRNQLCLFGRTMKWESAHRVIEYARKVGKWHRAGDLTSGDLYKMRKWALMFQSYYNDGNAMGLRYAALNAYNIGKKLDGNKNYPNDVIAFLESLQNTGNDSPIHHLQVICDYALYKNRRQDNERF